ncbi:phosphoacetylglucosamine mutase-like isoform X3 [Oscarella lobularis]|uniref:phosphoacetylglucosamine mutase-like isoform X3 n=1 Tax=Oscarella lobularis TaxID=121494 RepID=UPI003313FD5B
MKRFSPSVASAASKHPKTLSKKFDYGTAGFRDKAENLDSVMFRMGLLAVLRAKSTKGEVGVVVTASHNPIQDNGVKLIDPMGEMLTMEWESYARDLANTTDELLIDELSKIVEREGIDLDFDSPSIPIGMDTRPSSPKLSEAIQDGIKALHGKYTDLGHMTTPQVHFIVRCLNTNGLYGEPSERGYFMKLVTAFYNLNQSSSSENASLYVDGANGVGAHKIPILLRCLEELKTANQQCSFDVIVCNDGREGKLNENCGADYVKTNQCPPQGIVMKQGKRYCSFDGDADRIIFFYQGKQSCRVLDGDRIACLLSDYVHEMLTLLKIEGLSVAAIMTGYSNGNAINYLKGKDIRVEIVPTGVKHLKKKCEEFDVAIAFEANGHGNMVVKEDVRRKIEKIAKERDGNKAEAAEIVKNLIDLTNQTVGDAISNMLLVETILRKKNWTFDEWAQCYVDLPSKQVKVKVADRGMVKTTWNEQRVTDPLVLQKKIDELVEKHPNSRAFVRPSGTEDVVRVYAEAETREIADWLARQVEINVYELAHGEGEKPCPLHVI